MSVSSPLPRGYTVKVRAEDVAEAMSTWLQEELLYGNLPVVNGDTIDVAHVVGVEEAMSGESMFYLVTAEGQRFRVMIGE